MKKTTRWLAVIMYAAVIFLASSVSRLPAVSGRYETDKVAHFVEYFLFAMVIWWALVASTGRGAAAVIAAVIATAYGGTDEFHQAFVPGRNSSALDWATDAVGAIAGAAVAYLTARVRGLRRG